MAQNPLPPPPPSGGVLDGWLYMLWRRLTQAGQILWESITPGTSADVAAVVTDETGSPGSLVFSANPTLQGLTVESGSIIGGDTVARTLGGSVPTYQLSGTGAAAFLSVMRYTPGGGGASIALASSKGTAGTNSPLAENDGLGSLIVYGDDGSSIINNVGYIRFNVDGAVSTGIVPSRLTFVVMNSSGANIEVLRATSAGVVTLGGASSSPALKITPVASQTRWVEVTGATSSTNPTIGVSGGNLELSGDIVAPDVYANTSATAANVYIDATGLLHRATSGGGGVTVTEIEHDFGTKPIYDATFTIADAAIASSSSSIVITPCGKAATGRTADDWQFDGATITANPGTGSAEVYVTFHPGPVVGPRKFQYMVA